MLQPPGIACLEPWHARCFGWGGDWGGIDRDGSWRDVSLEGAPIGPRCTAAWTGSEMIVWTDGDDGPIGGRYDPARDDWRSMSSPDLPLFGASVWTGLEMLVWDPVLETGGLYEPAGDAWSPFHAAGAPPRGQATEVLWTGTELIASDATGGHAWRYDVDDNRWNPTLLTVSPSCPRK